MSGTASLDQQQDASPQETSRGSHPFTESHLRDLVGREFPGGEFTIEPHRQWLLNDVVLGRPGGFPEPGSLAHPLYVYLSTGAMGITWDELFEWCGAAAEDGPMFGEHETDVISPLLVGSTYTVTGRIVSGVRKAGRRAGVFDIVAYTLDIADAAGERVASTTNSIVFPRRSE
jgi:hypothetical protein